MRQAQAFKIVSMHSKERDQGSADRSEPRTPPGMSHLSRERQTDREGERGRRGGPGGGGVMARAARLKNRAVAGVICPSRGHALSLTNVCRAETQNSPDEKCPRSE